MGTRKLRRDLKKWIASITAIVLALTVISVTGFKGLFADEGGPVTIETTQTLSDDPTSSVITVNATAKEGYIINSITFNNEEVAGTQGTFTVTANGEYQIAVKYVSEGTTYVPTPSASVEASAEATASAEASEEPIDEEFGVSTETATPEVTEEVTPVVTESATPEVTEEVVTPEVAEEVVPEVTEEVVPEEAVPSEQSEEPVTEEVTPESAFFFTAVYAEEDPTPEATETTEVTETTEAPMATEEIYTETITVEGVYETGAFVPVEDTDEMYDNLVAILGDGVTVTKNEEKSTELGYNVYDAVAIDPSDELAVAVEGTYAHGFTAGSKDETTGWFIAIPGLDPIQWAFSFSDATVADHDVEAREAIEYGTDNVTISNIKVTNESDHCQVNLNVAGGTVADYLAASPFCPIDKLDANSQNGNQLVSLSFDWKLDTGTGPLIQDGDTVKIRVAGYYMQDAAPVELKDITNTVIGKWEISDGYIILTFEEVDAAETHTLVGSITTPKMIQYHGYSREDNSYVIINGSIGGTPAKYVKGQSKIRINNDNQMSFNKWAEGRSSSDVVWGIDANNAATSFVNHGGAYMGSYENVVFEDTFDPGVIIRGAQLQTFILAADENSPSGVGSNYLAYDKPQYFALEGENAIKEITPNSGETYQDFKIRVSSMPNQWGKYENAIGTTTVVAYLGSMDGTNPNDVTYDDLFPQGVGTYLKSTPTYSFISDTMVDHLNNLYAGKDIQYFRFMITARYGSVGTTTQVVNSATVNDSPVQGTVNLTPGASYLETPPKFAVKLIKIGNYGSFVDGEFKLQTFREDTSTWVDFSYLGTPTTGSGSGLALKTNNGVLEVGGLSSSATGITYRIVETSVETPGYHPVNSTIYPECSDSVTSNCRIATGLVSETFTVTDDETEGHIITMTNKLQEVNYQVKHYKQNADGTWPTTPTDTDTVSGVPGTGATYTYKSYPGYSIYSKLFTDGSHTDVDITSTPAYVSSGLVISIKYSINTNTPYKVEYYKQKVGETAGVLASYEIVTADTYFGTGTTNAALTYGTTAFPSKTYTGFTQNTTLSDASGTIDGTGNTVLKVYFDLNEYTVKYETNGGTAIADQTGVVWSQDALTPANNPTRSDYTFAGWFTNAALTTPYTSTQTYGDIAGTDTTMFITLYAKWTLNATPNPGRTCQDDGYPAGYNWNGTACVCTEQICMVTPPPVTPRPTTTPGIVTPRPSTTPGPTTTPNVVTPRPSTTPGPNVTPGSSPKTSPTATNSASSNTGSMSPSSDVNISKTGPTDSADHPSYGWTSGKWALINLIAALVTLVLAIVLLVNKSTKEEDEEDETAKRYNTKGEEIPNIFKRNKIYKGILAVVAVVSILLFILTENINMPMQLVDKWTLLMLVLAALSIIGFILGRRWTEDEDAEQDRLAE